MKQIRFIVLFLSHFFSRYFRRSGSHTKVNRSSSPYFDYRILFLLPLALIIFVLLGITKVNFNLEPSVSEGIIGVYTKNNLPPIVTSLISRPLVSLDKSSRPQPDLAAGWQVNNDATLYTFKLKDNLYWNDGSKVRASGIKFNLADDVDISFPDDKTIVFKLADSFDPFPSLLTVPIFKGDTLIGIGNFNVVREDLNRSIVTKLILKPKDSNLPRLIVRFYPDENTAKTAFELGEVESLIGTSETKDASSQFSANIKGMTNFNKLVAIFYNTEDSVVGDKNMRKALTASSPLIDNEERAKTSISPFSWAYNNELRDLLGDQELFKSYYDKVVSGKDSTIILTTTPSLLAVGEKIVKSWKQAGISANLRVESGVPQNFQALLLSESIPSDPDQYALWHSTQDKTNISKYSSPRADKDLEDGRKTSDLELRKEKYLDLQKVLLDDSPATFLYFPKTQVIYRPKVENNLNKILSLQLPNN